MNETPCPLISVITPVYNAAKFLPRLFDSVKKQRGVTFEHILVDDGSTDDSLQIMKILAAGNPTIKIIGLPKNRGPVVARNIAIGEAKGRYLSFLDADDYWLPEKSLAQSQFMEATGAAISFTDCRYISEDGELVGRLLSGPNKIGWSSHHMTRYLACLTIMVNREKCKDFTFPDISPSYRAEDFLAWSSILLTYDYALRCPHDLARYSVVLNSRSSNYRRNAASVWKLYRVVEKLPMLNAVAYYVLYAVFGMFKRVWCQPQWQSSIIDGTLADAYKLRAPK